VRPTGPAPHDQGAMNSLNPVYTIRRQITDTIAAHRPEWSPKQRDERAAELLDMVGIAPDRMRSFPHQLSGGCPFRTRCEFAMPVCAHTHPELGPSALNEPHRGVACLLHAGDHELPEASARRRRDHRTVLAQHIAVRLLVASRLECAFPLGRLPHVVAGCWAPVRRSWRAPGAGLAGFRRTGQAGQGRLDVPEPPRTRAGVRRPVGAGRYQGRRRSAASGRASRSLAWQAMTVVRRWTWPRGRADRSPPGESLRLRGPEHIGGHRAAGPA
jgi:hypothetical protein